MKRLRVIILSPLPALRLGLRSLLSEELRDEIEIGEAGSWEDLSKYPAEADVILAAHPPSAEHGRLDAFLLAEIGQWLRDCFPKDIPPALLLLTDHPRDALNIIALPWRAWGVLPLEATGRELGLGVQVVAEGLQLGPSGYLAALLQETHSLLSSSRVDAAVEMRPALTERESQVFELLARGLANKQIARELGISAHTVKFHVNSIYQKLGVTNRAEAVRNGVRLGLISL